MNKKLGICLIHQGICLIHQSFWAVFAIWKFMATFPQLSKIEIFFFGLIICNLNWFDFWKWFLFICTTRVVLMPFMMMRWDFMHNTSFIHVIGDWWCVVLAILCSPVEKWERRQCLGMPNGHEVQSVPTYWPSPPISCIILRH